MKLLSITILKNESGTVDAPIGRHPVNRKMMAINPKNGKNSNHAL